MTHTPGPWKYDQAPGGWYRTRRSIFGNKYSRPGVTDGRDFIAQVLGQTEEQVEANARLIAAAPALLEALERIAGTHYESAQYARQIARAAIALAKGETEI